jgi:CRISPR-associated endonuclease/helicase Cas3
MKVYYAHTENEQGNLHLLKEHLMGTAELMKNFCFIPELKKMFYLTGLLHDFGKYQDAFQRYLINGGIRGSVPHAKWGGFYLGVKYPEIAFAINGHHKGLPNKEGLKADFSKSNEEEQELSLLIQKINNEIPNLLEIDRLNLQFNQADFSRSERELLVRYLFSCLTDADWLDTEKHANFKKFSLRVREDFDPEKLSTLLNKYLENFSKDGKINTLRNQTRDYALTKAKDAQGFFSMNLPTGLGKTLASVAWALEHAKHHNLKRLIIVLPFISIIDQTAKELKKIFGEDLVLEHHSSFEVLDEDKEINDANISLISKRLAFENWDYPIIVTTSVQFFESLFSNRTSKCRKIHRIAESVVIFDEVQSLKKELVLPTLEMLQDINTVLRTSFLFCTATQPAFHSRDGFKGLNKITSLVDKPSDLFEQTKRVDYFLLCEGKALAIEDFSKIISHDTRSKLIVVNTKKTALSVYHSLKKERLNNIVFLSTDLCPSDRKLKIEKIRNNLKEEKQITVVSTQLIEAGVDFDFPLVYREIAPMESVIQAAGRCNREGKMKKKGEVYVFRVLESGFPDLQYKNLATFCLELIKQDISRLHNFDSYESYYEAVVNLYVDADKYRISESRKNFQFEDVAQSYKLINQATKPLLIANYNEESQLLVAELKKRDTLKLSVTKDLFRKMQQYSVQVYIDFLENNKHLVQVVNEVLVWVGKYDENIGIKGEQFTINDFIVS